MMRNRMSLAALLAFGAGLGGNPVGESVTISRRNEDYRTILKDSAPRGYSIARKRGPGIGGRLAKRIAAKRRNRLRAKGQHRQAVR